MLDERASTVDIKAEFEGEQTLHYPERLYGVWMNGAKGEATPYLMDQHTFTRSFAAITYAHKWATVPGQQAIVYHRQSGMILVQFVQSMNGERGCQIFHPDGHRVWVTAAHLFADVPALCWRQKRSIIFQTFVPAKSALLLPWSNYRIARQKLAHALKERGILAQPQESLAELLARVRLLLRDDNRYAPEEPIGEVLFDPEVAYYDASLLKTLLLALAPAFHWDSDFDTTWQGRPVRVRFKKWSCNLQWELTITEQEKGKRQATPPVVWTVAHPDGDQAEIHHLHEWEMLALDVLRWRMLFELDTGEYAEGLEADFDPLTSFVADTVDRCVPAPNAYTELQATLGLEQRFFTAVAGGFAEASAASLVYLQIRTHIEELYRMHWYKLGEQVRGLTA